MRIDFAITTHFEHRILGQIDILGGRVFGLEPAACALAAVTLHRELSGQQRQHDRAIDCRAGAIDHTAMSPGNTPAPVMLAPAIRTAKVAAEFSISSSLNSSGRSR
jgi:hypothetical protein